MLSLIGLVKEEVYSLIEINMLTFHSRGLADMSRCYTFEYFHNSPSNPKSFLLIVDTFKLNCFECSPLKLSVLHNRPAGALFYVTLKMVFSRFAVFS